MTLEQLFKSKARRKKDETLFFKLVKYLDKCGVEITKEQFDFLNKNNYQERKNVQCKF